MSFDRLITANINKNLRSWADELYNLGSLPDWVRDDTHHKASLGLIARDTLFYTFSDTHLSDRHVKLDYSDKGLCVAYDPLIWAFLDQLRRYKDFLSEYKRERSNFVRRFSIPTSKIFFRSGDWMIKILKFCAFQSGLTCSEVIDFVLAGRLYRYDKREFGLLHEKLDDCILKSLDLQNLVISWGYVALQDKIKED